MAASEMSYITIHADHSTQGAYTETIGGLIYTYKLDSDVEPKYLIHGGAFVRLKDAIIPVAKLEMRPLSVSVSYDANISKLSSATNGRGGFELALSYQKFIERNSTSRNAVRCPRF
jgi:hypothetical protein